MSDFREFGEIDGAMIEVRIVSDDWSGDVPGALSRLNGVAHATIGRALRAHRESLPVPEAAPAVYEEPLEVRETLTDWGLVIESRFAEGSMIESVSPEFTGPNGEVIVRRRRVFSTGRDPRRRLDVPALPAIYGAGGCEALGTKATPLDVGHEADWGRSRMPAEGWPPGQLPEGALDPELEEAMRWRAYYGSAALDPVERLQRDRERQARDAQRKAASIAAEKDRKILLEAIETAEWCAGRAIAAVLERPGAVGPRPKTVYTSPSPGLRD